MQEISKKLKISLKELADFFMVTHANLRVLIHRKFTPAAYIPYELTLKNYCEHMKEEDLNEARVVLDQPQAAKIAKHLNLRLLKLSLDLHNSRKQLARLEAQREKTFRRWHLARNLKQYIHELVPDKVVEQKNTTRRTRKRVKAKPPLATKREFAAWAHSISKTTEQAYKEFDYKKYSNLKQKIVGLEAEKNYLESWVVENNQS